jgi:hypothetical protein
MELIGSSPGCGRDRSAPSGPHRMMKGASAIETPRPGAQYDWLSRQSNDLEHGVLTCIKGCPQQIGDGQERKKP